MAEVNKVIYGTRILIDLTSDTVSEATLLTGSTAHKNDGTLITGTLLSGYPESLEINTEYIQDASNEDLLDSDGNSITDRWIYLRA